MNAVAAAVRALALSAGLAGCAGPAPLPLELPDLPSGAIAVLPLAPAPAGVLEPTTALQAEVEASIVGCAWGGRDVVPPDALRTIVSRMRGDVAVAQQIDAQELGSSARSTIGRYALRELLADSPAVSTLVRPRWVRTQAPYPQFVARWHGVAAAVPGAPVGWWARFVHGPGAQPIRTLSLEIRIEARRGDLIASRFVGVALLEGLDHAYQLERRPLHGGTLHPAALGAAIGRALAPLCNPS